MKSRRVSVLVGFNALHRRDRRSELGKLSVDRIEADNGKSALYAHLAEVYAKLDIPGSSAPQIIIDRAVGL
jgi:hypothetical protein